MAGSRGTRGAYWGCGWASADQLHLVRQGGLLRPCPRGGPARPAVWEPDRPLGARGHRARLRHRGAGRHPWSGIALPSIGARFSTSAWPPCSGWSTPNTLSLAGLLLLGGHARRTATGAGRSSSSARLWFALASLLCGVAPNDITLILARALQGVGAALLDPGGAFRSCRPLSWRTNRSRAIGAWSGLGRPGHRGSGRSSAAGLISAVSWRLVFFIKPCRSPPRSSPSHRPPTWPEFPAATGREPGGWTSPGAVTITGGLVGLTYRAH